MVARLLPPADPGVDAGRLEALRRTAFNSRWSILMSALRAKALRQ